MANYRLKFSHFIPNSWFHKNKFTKKQQQRSSSSSTTITTNPLNQNNHPLTDQRKSYYFTRDLMDTRSTDPPKKSNKKKKQLSTGKCHTPESISISTVSNSSDADFLSPELTSCSSYDDVYRKVDLPPIITKSTMMTPATHTRSLVRRSVSGGKVKGNCYSPRVGNRVRVYGINGGGGGGGGGRRSNGGYRRSLAESMAVVKRSVDPGKDFKESMVEMIMENNMKSSKDLEDLLACYLLLNSDEYHELIIRVFKQIWFESTDIQL